MNQARFWALALVLCTAGLVVHRPAHVSAQATDMRVIITRPGEGETLYAAPGTPYVTAPVTGRVTAGEFDMRQLQVRLELFQGTQSFGALTTTPNPDGLFAFDVGINRELSPTKNSGEYGCKSACHAAGTIGLPAGAVTLRVTVSDPLGRKAIAERSITSDHSGYADVPVQVVVEGNSNQPVPGVYVRAETRVYSWRARQYSVKTDDQGRAMLHVEALGEAPTRYVVHVEPRVVDGALYSSRSISVTLAPGAKTIAPILLTADSQRGRVDGTIVPRALSPDSSALTVRAIELPGGPSHTAQVLQGKFNFADLSLAQYLLVLDDAQTAAPGEWAEPLMADLSASPAITASLKLASARQVRGVVRDEGGRRLPLAWVATENRDRIARAGPSNGEFSLALSGQERALWVTVPGYWTQPVVLADRMDITLDPQPETRRIPWGSGSLTLPSETLAEASANRVAMQRGWIWGQGDGSLTLHTSDADVTLQSGSFALEYVPGETNWFYLLEGAAKLVPSGGDQSLDMTAGQMVAFGKGVTKPSIVRLEDATVRAIHGGEPLPVAIAADPAPLARARDELARLGVSQITALAMLVCAATVVVGLRLIVPRARKGARQAPRQE